MATAPAKRAEWNSTLSYWLTPARLCAVAAYFLFAGLTVAQSDSSDVNEAAATIEVAPKKSNDALTDTIFYESEYIDYDADKKVLLLLGQAQVKYQNITLQADTIVYTVDENQFQARGKPQLIEGSDTTAGDFMVYNIKTRRGRVSYATIHFEDTYFTGSSIVKSAENHLYIDEGDYTSCINAEHPDYFFYSRNVKIIPNDKIISRPVILNIGDAPIIMLPYFIMPLQKGRRSGWLTPMWGGNLNRGGYVDNIGYYYAPNDYVDFTIRAKAQEFSSFVLNASSNYALRYTLDGYVSGRYVLDNNLENAGQQWALEYRHNQLLTPDGRTRLSGYGELLSTRTFNQLYSDETREIEKQQLDANLSLSHKFESINASANLVWRRNHNLTTDRILEDMPYLDFNLHNRAIFPFVPGSDTSKTEPSWYNNIYYSYNTKANVRRDVYGADSLPGFIRPGMEHNLNLNSSQKILKYLDISPYFDTRASMFYGAIDTLVKDTLYIKDTVTYKVKNPDKDTRYPYYTLLDQIPEYFINENGDLDTLYTIIKESPQRTHLVRDTLNNEFNLVRSWRAGVNLSTRIYGIFPVGIFNVTGVRHILTPTVGYSYVPKHNLDRTFYDVRIAYDAPRSKPQQLVNFSLANQFQGKRFVGEGNSKKEQKFDILNVSASTAYDLEADNRKWRDLQLSASTSYSFLRLGYSSGFWFYDSDNKLVTPIQKDYSINLTSSNLSVSGSFWDGDLLRLDSLRSYVDPLDHQGRSGGSQSWNLGFSPSYNYRARRITPEEPFIPTKSFNLSTTAGFGFTNSLSVRWNGNYDFSSNQFTHNNFHFMYDLECWEMRFTWRPEKINPGYAFVVNVKKIPDIKWEQKGSKPVSQYSDSYYY
ncbi:MAG: hypothetical protein LBI42_09085 [Chitinispirillales bacterium]|jgi:lipopolysaccharide assembly outer membrane protein LptD (OstA)|nr:hypothetical protein [Chitinispirillales bacterium]